MKNFSTKYTLLALATSLCLLACNAEQAPTNTNAETTTPAATVSESAATPVASETANVITYQVGSDINYEPFAFKDEQGQPTGFEVELLQEIGKVAKFNVEFIQNPRSEVVDTLNNEKFDIWAATLSTSSDRKALVDMSEPYSSFVRQIYVLDKPENGGLQKPSDFQGKKIAVSNVSKSFIKTATELTGSPDNVLQAEGFFKSLQEVYIGRADGVLGDDKVLQYYSLKHKDVKTRAIDMGDEKKEVAFAVKKGNKEVLDKINEGLRAVKADGTYDKLVEKWFGQVAQ